MSADLAPFLGLWFLDRDRSDHGDPPRAHRGLCRIALDNGVVYAQMRDGARVRCDLVDAELISEVHDGDRRVARVVRRALGADTLSIEQIHDSPEPVRITAIYRRVLEDVKQVLLYRRDLQMRKGKIAAQIAHASLMVFLDRDRGGWDRLEIPLDAAMASWTRARFAKIVLSVEGEADLVRAYDEARARGLPTALITDAGHTEFHGVPTRTTVAIGPARVAEIDPITGPEGLVATKLA